MGSVGSVSDGRMDGMTATATERRKTITAIRVALRQLDGWVRTPPDRLDITIEDPFFAGQTPRAVIEMYLGEVQGLTAQLQEHYEGKV